MKPPTVVALENDSAVVLEVLNAAVPVGTVPGPSCCRVEVATARAGEPGGVRARAAPVVPKCEW
jgi:hypothetical protein